MKNYDCVYYEEITETQGYPIQISDNSDEYDIGYEEVPVGEFCNCPEIYDHTFNCKDCKHYEKRTHHEQTRCDRNI